MPPERPAAPRSLWTLPDWFPSRVMLALGLLYVLVSLGIMLFFSPHYQLYNKVTGIRAPGLPPFGGDFLSEWVGGYIVRQGDLSRLYETKYAIEIEHDENLLGFAWEKGSYLRLFYPPCYYLLVSPLSRLGVSAAAVVWCLTMWACLLAAVWLFAGLDPVCRRLSGWWLILAMIFGPLSESLNSGQKGSLWLLVLVLNLRLLQRARGFAAGAVYGLLALKPPLAPVIGLAMLLKRQWWFVAGSLAMGAVLAGLSLWLGWDVCMQYFRLTGDAANFTLVKNYPLHKENSWYGFFAALLRPMEWWTVIRVAAASLTVVSAVVLVRAVRGPWVFSSQRFYLIFSALVLGTLLVCPKLQTYDLTVVLLPVFLLLRLAIDPPEEFAPWRELLGGTALGLYAVTMLSEPVAQRIVVQLTPPALLAALAVIGYVNARVCGRCCGTGSQPVRAA